MVDGQKFIVVRFGTNIVENCIEKHIEVIEKYGHCWFGKIGVVPSTKVLQSVLAEETPKIILYTRNHAYECTLISTSEQKPENAFPDYYFDELFNTGRNPSIYFQLKDITPIEISELSRYVVVSSRNSLMQTLNRSMSSFFWAEAPGKGATTEENIKTNKKEKRNNLLDENDCKYRVEGKCTLKGFVNFQYECFRPNNCIRQKR